jgi:hypothetical protein
MEYERSCHPIFMLVAIPPLLVGLYILLIGVSRGSPELIIAGVGGLIVFLITSFYILFCPEKIL